MTSKTLLLHNSCSYNVASLTYLHDPGSAQMRERGGRGGGGEGGHQYIHQKQ